MGHPLIEEFCRVSGEFAPSFLRRCQRVFREEVQSQLDQRDVLLERVAALEGELADLRAVRAGRPGKARAASELVAD